jgi:hypothetical protein
MLIVSVGTGRTNKKLVGQKWTNPNLLNIAQAAPEQFMGDASELVEMMMHFIGKGTGPLRKIDSEIEDLSEDAINGGKAFSYVRYNVEMVKEVLDKLDNDVLTNLSDTKISNLMNMDLPENVDLLTTVGEAAAKKYVEAGHLPEAFNLRSV